MKKQFSWMIIFLFMVAGAILVSCSGTQLGSENESIPLDETSSQVNLPVEAIEPGVYVFPEGYVAVENPFMDDPESVAKGEKIFGASCERCHGIEGKGDGTYAINNDLTMVSYADENIMALTDAELFFILTNGIEGTAMESWDTYSDDLRWHLVNYVRSLQGK